LAQQNAAVASARSAERIVTSQYRAGTTLYFSVVTSQNLALSNERAALQVQGRLLAASVALIKATGGGWQTPVASMPVADPLPKYKTQK